MSLLPASQLRHRRRVALLGLWLTALLPWLPVSLMPSSNAELGVPSFSTWIAWVYCVWLLGSTMAAVRLMTEFLWLSRMRGGAVHHSQTHGVSIYLSPALTVPCVAGCRSPVIYMPTAALQWPQNQWNAAVRHELEHTAQADVLHRILAAMMRVLLWWNPLIHALCSRLEIETELCCDEVALEAAGRRTYGELLLALALDGAPDTTPSLGHRRGFQERMTRLLRPSDAPASWVRMLLCGATVIAAVLLALTISQRRDRLLFDEAALRLSADPFPQN